MLLFVTGSTGFVGGALVRRLAADGHEVRALVRPRHAAAMFDHPRIACYPGDITEPDSLRVPMTGVDGVFHVAGWYKIGDPDVRTAERVNVDGTANVLRLMRELGVPRGVYTSTLAVNSDTRGRLVDEEYRYQGPFLSVYERTKAAAHEMALGEMAAGLPLVIVQPGLIYGPGDTSSVGTMWRRFLQRKVPALPARTAFCWSHVDDIADGHVRALVNGRPGRSYFLAGPPATLVEAVERAARLTGIPAPGRTIPPRVLKGAAAIAARVERVVRLPPEYTAEGLRTLAGVTYLGCDDRARQELGWSARPLDLGLAETLRHELNVLGMSVTF